MNLNQLSSSVQNLAKQYAAVIEVGKFLSSLASLDNLSNELQAEHDRVAGVLVEANAQLAGVQSAIAEHTASHEANIKASREQAVQIVAEARVQAEAIAHDARAYATRTEEGAQARLEAHDAAFQAQQVVAEALRVEVEHKRTILAGLEARVAELRAKFA